MPRITPTFIALSISIGFLARGYSLAGLDVFTRQVLFFGFLWLIARYNRWDWFPTVALIIVILASALGLWLDLHAGWMIGASIFSLAFWDLTELDRQTRAMPKAEMRKIEQIHLARLGFLTMLGLAFASLLLFLRSQLTWDWGISCITITGISLVLVMTGRRKG